MHYDLGTPDPSVSASVVSPASAASPTFSLPAAPPPPAVPIGTSGNRRDSTSAPRATSSGALPERPGQKAARSTFPSPPSHPNPAFASVLKREAAVEDRLAQAASVAGPSTQPETAIAASASLSGTSTDPIRLTGATEEHAQDGEGEGAEDYEEDEAPHTFSERFKDAMAENSAVVSTFIAGGLAGAASRTVVSPLERLKIILQVQTAPAAVGSGTSGQAYGAMWPSLVRMWKEEGFRGFMKGNGINVVRILPYSAIQFTSYGYSKKLFAKWSGQEQLSTPLRLAAGASAGILAVSATYPLDLVRARLSIATANMARSSVSHGFTAEDAKLGIVGMTKKVYRTEGGVKGLYRGCWATAVGVAPYVSLNFYIYETLRPLILPPDYHPSSEVELVGRKLLSGACAGGISLLFTHPFDVVRRKLQVVGIGGGEREFNGAIDCIRKISAKEGFWKGMYRGLTPNIIKVAPSIAVSFYTFETVKDALTALTTGNEERLV